jgi:hypothetical protein
MQHTAAAADQIKTVSTFQALVSLPFKNNFNALCWQRDLQGDFYEIVTKIKGIESMQVITEEHLQGLDLSAAGDCARNHILNDLAALKELGASPQLNLITHYLRDTEFPFFPTDVYSFHADRSPLPTDTYLCTYYGASSEILPNSQAEQKILLPEIRAELKKLYEGRAENFEDFLTEHFFDLHYQAKAGAEPISLGTGNFWRLAVNHPQSACLPCIHRAPEENHEQYRLLLIC